MKLMQKLLGNLGDVWNTLPKEVPYLNVLNDGIYNLVPSFKQWTLHENTRMRRANFVGKISGSVVENPHLYRQSSTVSAPTPTALMAGAERSQAEYNAIQVLGGTTGTRSTSVSGEAAYHSFHYSIIDHVIREHGVGVFGSAVTIAERVTWLKANVFRLTVNWHGNGSAPVGNKAYLSLWNTSTSLYDGTQTHNLGSIQKLTQTSTSMNVRIDANGLFNILAYSDASNGTIASSISTDMVEIEVYLKEGAVPIDDTVLRMGATLSSQNNDVFINVLPNTQYRITVANTGGLIIVRKADGLVTYLSSSAASINTLFTTDATTTQIYLRFSSNAGSVDITYSQPMLTQGSGAHPYFKPKLGKMHSMVTVDAGSVYFHSEPFRSGMITAQEIVIDGMTTAELLATMESLGYRASLTSEAVTAGMTAHKPYVMVEQQNVSIMANVKLPAFTSTVWTTLYPIYRVLREAEYNIDIALKQLYRDIASGSWLDYWASFFSLKREQGESDNDFTRRFTMWLFNPKTNNVALKELLVYRLKDTNIFVQDKAPNEFEVLVGAQYLSDASAINAILSDVKAAGVEYFLNYMTTPYAEDYRTYLADKTGVPFETTDVFFIQWARQFTDDYVKPTELPNHTLQTLFTETKSAPVEVSSPRISLPVTETTYTKPVELIGSVLQSIYTDTAPTKQELGVLQMAYSLAEQYVIEQPTLDIYFGLGEGELNFDELFDSKGQTYDVVTVTLTVDGVVVYTTNV